MKIFNMTIVALSFVLLTACDGDSLSHGPRSPGPHGPFSASDFDGNGEVTRTEIDQFISQGPEREVGMVAYFDLWDADKDQVLSEAELAVVEPAFAFDGSDANADGEVSLAEVEAYVSERQYRQMGLGEFFDLIDTDGDDVVSADEIEAAHVSGQLPRG